MKHYDFDVRIAYADTDRMGVVYYANYLVLFERGRREFLRSIGIRYRDMEGVRKIYMPAMESHIDYYAPARYDDILLIRSELTLVRSRQFSFSYEIRLASNDTLCLTASSDHIVVTQSTGRPARLPAELLQLLSSNE